MITTTQLISCYQQACEIELQAFKPGNVSLYSAAHDMTVTDFRLSYQVSAAPLCNRAYSLGEKIYYAVLATRTAVGCNTNLGIILLAAPLLTAAIYSSQTGLTLRVALQHILAHTTLDDANEVFRAICLANPAGLGTTDQQDVQHPATISLTEVMRLASDKDRIALQYCSDYADIFDFACVSYYNAWDMWQSKPWAAVAVYAALLQHFPDSHVERKYSTRYSAMIAQAMVQLNDALAYQHSTHLMPLLYHIDHNFKSNRINPGTTADMTVATLLTVFLTQALG
jgi:triphosphoribosyl-dephospho-CoA synthase